MLSVLARPLPAAVFQSEHKGVSIYHMPRESNEFPIQVYVHWQSGAVYSKDATEAELFTAMAEFKAEKAANIAAFNERMGKASEARDWADYVYCMGMSGALVERLQRLHFIAYPARNLECYVVQLCNVRTAEPIAVQQMSPDAGSFLRRRFAEKLCRKHSSPLDCFIVEFAKLNKDPDDLGLVIDKYMLD